MRKLVLIRILRYFNSIKVRLKHSSFSFPKRNELFQFHKGTIKTASRQGRFPPCSHFNSIKVRLKPKDTSDAEAVEFISIP